MAKYRTHTYLADDGVTLLFEHRKHLESGRWGYRHPISGPECPEAEHREKGKKVYEYRGQWWCAGKPAIAASRLHNHGPLVAALDAGEPVASTAGEKDSDALSDALRAAGLPSVTTSVHQGESRRGFTPEQLEVFRGTTSPIAIYMDQDGRKASWATSFTGQKNALRRYEELARVVADPSQLSLWEPALGFKDVALHLEAGRGLERFRRISADKLRSSLRKAEKTFDNSSKESAENPADVKLTKFHEALKAKGLKPGSGEDWQCPHPGHEDSNPSFGVRPGKNGGLVIDCQKCAPEREDKAARKQWIREVLDFLELPHDFLRPSRPRESNTWEPIDLADAIAGRRGPDKPSVGLLANGQGLFYPGKTHAVSGEPESMKTWLLLASSAQDVNLSNCIMYIDFEDDAHSVVGRLQNLGVANEDIAKQFIYIRPEDELDGDQREVLAALIEERKPTLVVIDGVTEGMALHGKDPLSNNDVAEWMKWLPKKLAAVTSAGYLGPAVVMIDHVAKDKDGRGRGGIGAQHKLASLSGAHYSLEVKAPLAPGATGIATLKVTKDRPGRIRERATGKRRDLVGELVIASASDGALMAEITEPSERITPDPTDSRPEELMQQISEYVRAYPGMSKNHIKAGVKGRALVKDLALQLLVNEGYIKVETGARNSQLHTFIKPYNGPVFGLNQEG